MRECHASAAPYRHREQRDQHTPRAIAVQRHAQRQLHERETEEKRPCQQTQLRGTHAQLDTEYRRQRGRHGA